MITKSMVLMVVKTSPKRRLAPVHPPGWYHLRFAIKQWKEKMKQKYVISRNDDNASITITEYSEVDKDIFAQLCAESFLIADLPDPIQENTESVIQTFRSRNLFPPSDYAARIADSMAHLLADDSQRIVEVKIDDKAEITERRIAAEKLAEEATGASLKSDELDTILESDTATTTTAKAKTGNK
jgi:hypothetical protein